MSHLEYKGYQGSVKYSTEDDVLFGKIEFIRDLVDYHATGISGLKKAFKEAVDDYLTTCKELNKKPDKPFKGSFNIRIGTDLHRKIALEATKDDVSHNEIIIKALETYFNNDISDRKLLVQNIHVKQYCDGTQLSDIKREQSEFEASALETPIQFKTGGNK